jgi:hypothetical protein
MLNKQHLYGTIRNEERVFTDAYENKKTRGVCSLASLPSGRSILRDQFL